MELLLEPFHEGIMQTVTGFIPNNTYTIHLQQSVVKQINCLDQSGSWEVYFDNNLLGITLPTFSNAPYNNASFIWESRSLSFTATAISHTIKFLPHDDDSNIAISPTDTLGALRMGIDSMYITSCNLTTLNLGNDTTLCLGETLTLDVTIPNATYLWQDNSTNPTFNVTQQGTYWTEVTVNNCTAIDTIYINYNPLPTVNLGNDTALCQYEILTLSTTNPNATYLWQDNSINPTFDVTQQGIYSVEVTVNNCSSTDVILISEEDCEIILKIPNVFTPNNDGSNDLFVPIISKGIISLKTILYNRWGNKIFESNKRLIEWSGQDVSAETYFWVVYSTDINGVNNILKGYVTLMK